MDLELHSQLEPEYTPRSTPNPRRRKKTKLQIFKEAYLPLIIVAMTFVLLVVFIIGGIRRNDSSAGTSSESTNHSTAPSSSTTETTLPPETLELQAEAKELMAQAALLMPDYDYAGALAILDTFSGDMALFPELSAVYAHYQSELAKMVPWTGGQVINLSFQLLIADPERAFQDVTYGKQYRNNFITVTEFAAILQQLYDNDYILVSLADLYESVHDESSDRDIWVEKTLLLPPGKTPVMLTETNANYYAYMVDPDKNGVPDANAAGFAYKLCYGEDGFYNEIVLADGSIVKGPFDMVPQLEAFIAEHPDFSYRNARAIIAFSGYDGILGYRLYSSKLTPAQQLEEQAAAAAVVNALRETGYDIACFTYGNSNKGTLDYGKLEPEAILADLSLWKEKIEPVIGETNIFVFAKEDDIAGEESYIGNTKFNAMHNERYGNFDFFLSAGIGAWNQVENEYVRHRRLMVTGSYLQKYPERFAELFDAASILDPYRANYN